MAQIKINLKRSKVGTKKTLVEFHLPTGVFAILSLISFFIDPDQVAGRIGMLLTLNLISFTSYGSLKAPPNRGFSNIDLWFVGIQFPIVMAILEYGMVLALRRFYQEKFVKSFISVIDFIFFVVALITLGVFNLYYWTQEHVSPF